MAMTRVQRRWVLIGYWFALFVGTHTPDLDRYASGLGAWSFEHMDLIAHAILYSGWILAWWGLLSAEGRRVSGRQVSWLVIGGALWAMFDELTQALVGRTPDLADYAVDLLAMWVTLTVLWRRQSRRGAGSSARPRRAGATLSG